MRNRQGSPTVARSRSLDLLFATSGEPGFGSWRDFAIKSSGCFFENQAHFVVKNAFATNCLPGFLIARALAAHFAGYDGPAFDDGLPQLATEVKIPALAQDTGTVKTEHRPRHVEVCSIPEAVAPRDALTLKVKEIHPESFQVRISERQAYRVFSPLGFPSAIFLSQLMFSNRAGAMWFCSSKQSLIFASK